jgi:predicted DsbA family dithiol-disulfide isomerase
MKVLEVFADVACPFAHVGLARFTDLRRQRREIEPALRVRAWPLELVNGMAFDGPSLTPKIAALRAEVAPDMFDGFDARRFPSSTVPAMAAEAAAYRVGLDIGERFSLAVRRALFDEGQDVSDSDVLRCLRDTLGVPEPNPDDEAQVLADFADGTNRGVDGSPHFFTADGDFFCPSLEIEHDEQGYEVSFDTAGFQRFVGAVFG